ncbi:PREDICTED: ribonuclease P protein subunit p40-like isoform X2 [Ceratosolen solmsi marchali]|uniref:Ribonuclease P protein subunit p40-like isoform X2 n=1 Tax=Ceratosolen solmsi marchali TaxID=326594 RepID=A0AAJ6YN48_9HYME|nr:PREDICTED: ribonuclease P protein subunit p40-like isoform X2 [Ceratosolen solmsi marchali]
MKVSFVLPNICSIPEGFCESILEDSDYYRINGLRAVELINRTFINSFIKQGTFSLLTVDKRLDIDNLIAITPDGHLWLNLRRSCYQKLGIEGKPTRFERKEHSRYVVKINLKASKLTPGNKYYERIYTNLDKMLDLTFDVIISWDPLAERICPSSVAAWFDKRGFPVNICHQQVIRRCEYSLEIPALVQNNYKEFFEWLGVFCIDGNLINENKNMEAQYVSSYECPKPRIQVGQIQYLQFTGFFTQKKILKIYNAWKKYALLNNTILPWCTIDIQGFVDSPIKLNNQMEHSFYTNGDHSCTIAMCPSNNGYILRQSLNSRRMPKIKQ